MAKGQGTKIGLTLVRRLPQGQSVEPRKMGSTGKGSAHGNSWSDFQVGGDAGVDIQKNRFLPHYVMENPRNSC